MLHGRDRDLNPNSLASYPWFLTTTPQKEFTFWGISYIADFGLHVSFLLNLHQPYEVNFFYPHFTEEETHLGDEIMCPGSHS